MRVKNYNNLLFILILSLITHVDLVPSQPIIYYMAKLMREMISGKVKERKEMCYQKVTST
jgi:hypothetical protein